MYLQANLNASVSRTQRGWRDADLLRLRWDPGTLAGWLRELQNVPADTLAPTAKKQNTKKHLGVSVQGELVCV